MDVPLPSMSAEIPPPGGRRWRRLVGTRGIAAAVTVLAVAATVGASLWVIQPPPDPAWQGADDVALIAAAGAPIALTDETRPNFRYSIVPGGVHSVLEMRQAI